MKAEAGSPKAPTATVGKMSYRKLLGWSVTVIAGAPLLFAASLALAVAGVTLGQYSVRLLSRIISALAAPQRADQSVISLAVIYICVVIAVIALQYGARLLTIRADAAMLGALQCRLHDTLLRMPPAYHDAHDIGETTTIVLQDAPGCQPMLRDLVAFPITQGIGLVSAVIFLLQSLREIHDVPPAAQMALVAVLLLLPPLGWWFAGRVGHAYDAVRAAQAGVASEFANSASAPLEVRLMGAAGQRSRAFAARLGVLMTRRVQAQSRSETANQFQNAMPVLLQAGFLAYAATAAVRVGAAAAGAILSIYYFVPKVVEPLDQIIRFFGGMQMIWVQAARLGAVLDAREPGVTAGSGDVGPAPEIAFENVVFAYDGAAAPVLRGVTARFPGGRVSAIIGRSGAGKSSLLGLIDGVREPASGVVRIGGRPVASLGPQRLLDAVAVVSQFPLFIADSVRANFRLAAEAADDAEIEAVARAVGLWPALVRLGGAAPLDHPLPRVVGQGLSGGERRLFAVARMLLRRPAVLLLDEPTTGVDAMSIGELLAGLRQACAGVTVVMVEHNLDVVRSLADEVCCLEDGRIVDRGTPDELAARPSLFSRLLAARDRVGGVEGLDIESVAMPVAGAGDPWGAPAAMMQPVPIRQGGKR
jgi:ABC-type multidrug transport system fused ATPase/permease subunit